MAKSKSDNKCTTEEGENLWGQRLKLLLKQKQLSQSQVCRQMGIKENILSGWINKSCMPSSSNIKVLKRWCSEQGINFSILLTGENDTEELNLCQLFNETPLIDGYYRISVTKLTEKKK